MANYNPIYPTGVSVDDGIKEFITTFYGVSDTPGKNQEWMDFFREDATLVMEKKEGTGKTGKSKRNNRSVPPTPSPQQQPQKRWPNR